jgi:hypothetical protein
MLSEVLICVLIFQFDRSLLLLAARLGVITLSWAILYNELYVHGLIDSGFQVNGPTEIVSALQRKFASADRAGRVRLLRERSLVFVVLGLGCLQAIADIAPQISNSWRAPSADRILPSSTPAPKPVTTPAIISPDPHPKMAPAPALPKEAPLPGPGPMAQSTPVSPGPANPVLPAPPPAVPKTVEVPRPSRSAEDILAERGRECDVLMGTQFDSDLPASVKYVADTSVLAEADIDRAIASCEAARTGSNRRYNTQLGRAYAARAVLLAARGNDSNARDTMNKAIAQWSAAETQGSGAAMNFLGAFYKGTFNSSIFTFVQPDYPRALQYWLRGDSAGNLKAARNAGGMLLLGTADFAGVPQNIKKSKELLGKAIKGGDMTAASLYGQALYYGYPTEVTKDSAAGLELLVRACASGDPSAKAFFDTELAKPKKQPLLPATRPTGC